MRLSPFKQTNMKTVWDKSGIEFLETNIDGNQAEVRVYVSHEFQLEDCPDPSFVGIEYHIVPAKANGHWLVSNISSNDAFDQAHSEYGIDVEALLRAPNKDEIEAVESIEAKKHVMIHLQTGAGQAAQALRTT